MNLKLGLIPFVVAILLAMFVSTTQVTVTQSNSDCPDAQSMFEIGNTVYVSDADPSSLPVREGLGFDSPVSEMLAPGEQMRLVSGPRCADGWYWWMVSNPINGELLGFVGEVGPEGLYNLVSQIGRNYCPMHIEPVEIGGMGQEVQGRPRLREEPGYDSRVINGLPRRGDRSFGIVSGPICVDEYWWWEVDYQGTIGWTEEGFEFGGDDGDEYEYWIEWVAGQAYPEFRCIPDCSQDEDSD